MAGVEMEGRRTSGRLAKRAAIVAIVLGAMISAGCGSPLGPQGGTGEVTVTVESAQLQAQTFLPDLLDTAASFRVTLSRDGADSLTETSAEVSLTFAEVPVGNWTVTAAALDAEAEVIASGSAQIVVAEGGECRNGRGGSKRRRLWYARSHVELVTGHADQRSGVGKADA